MGVPASPAFVLAVRGRGVGGDRGAGAATNAARQARPAQRAVRRTKKRKAAGSGVAWRCCAVVAASPAPPVVAYDSYGPTSTAPGFSSPCAHEGTRAHGKTPMAAPRR
jgi:hypothetical protein